MTDFFKSFKKYTLITSIALTALGLLFVFVPTLSVKILGYCISIAGIIISAIFIISGMRTKEYHWSQKFMISVWIVVLIISIYFTIKPNALVNAVYNILGIIILLNGISKFQTAFDLKRYKQDNWWIYLIVALVVIALGVTCILRPFDTAKYTLMLIGISLAVSGISDIISVFIMSRKCREINIRIDDSREDND